MGRSGQPGLLARVLFQWVPSSHSSAPWAGPAQGAGEERCPSTSPQAEDKCRALRVENHTIPAGPTGMGEASTAVSPRPGRGQGARLHYPSCLYRKLLCCVVNIQTFLKKKKKARVHAAIIDRLLFLAPFSIYSHWCYSNCMSLM